MKKRTKNDDLVACGMCGNDFARSSKASETHKVHICDDCASRVGAMISERDRG